MSINNVTLVGRITRDIQILANKAGKTALFTVAVERNYKDKEGNRPVDFVPVKAFIGEKAKSNGPFDFMAKGQLVAVEAELRSSQYEKNGQTVYGLDIVAKQGGITLLDRPKGKGGATEEVEASAEEAPTEDLPF